MQLQSPYCADCPRKYKPISGDGPQPCDVLIVGERPGANENKYQRVFIGKTGMELDQTYLPLARLRRRDVRVCNAVRCWADGNRTPTDREIDCCSRHHLPRELAVTQPRIVMLMGGSACRMVPGIRLDTHHGIPQWGKLYDWEGVVIPMYHPALGLHESKWMTQLLEDWENLAEHLMDVEPTATASYQTDYRIARGREVNDIALGEVVAIDTESHGREPFSVQVSSDKGYARMVLAEDREGLALLARRLRQAEGILHNAVHDLNELHALGISLHGFRDTMQEAYHLGSLPQALKPLVYRLFKFTMTSWEDVVRPYSLEALNCWMVEAQEIAAADLSLIEVKRYKKAYRGRTVKETVKPGPLEQLLKRLITHTDVAAEYDPWERLDAFWQDEANEWMTTHIEARIGKYPILGIGNAPLNKAVTYGCGDADWTSQVAAELHKRRMEPIWRIDEGDRDG